MKKCFLFLSLLITWQLIQAQALPQFEFLYNDFLKKNFVYNMVELPENEYLFAGGVEQEIGSYPAYSLLLLKINEWGDTVSKLISDFDEFYLTFRGVNIGIMNNQPFIVYTLQPYCPTNRVRSVNDDNKAHLVFAYIDENLNLTNEKKYYLPENITDFRLTPVIIPDQDNTITLCFTTFDSIAIQSTDTLVLERASTTFLYRMNSSGDTLYSGSYSNLLFSDIKILHNNDSSGYTLLGRGIRVSDLSSETNQITLSKDYSITNIKKFVSFTYHQQYHYFIGPGVDFFRHPTNKKIYFYSQCSIFDQHFHSIEPDVVCFGIMDDNYNVTQIHTEEYITNDQNAGLYNSINCLEPNPETIFFAEITNIFHPYATIYTFDENLNKKTEFYYQKDPAFHALAVFATSDEGCILLGDVPIIYGDFGYYVAQIVKFPQSAFVNIEEAQENGLSMAIAYPNPGNNQLFLRTTLPKAAVEVFDMTGHLMIQQKIETTETVLNTEAWEAGTYVWRIFSNDKVAETGKWIKQ